MTVTSLRRTIPAVLSAALVAVAISACGSSNEKTLVVASDATYPPMESIGTDGKTVVGADADLAAAIGKKLGYTVKVQNATFDSILAGIKAGKYDVGMSSFTDNKEREKEVDFVTYLTAGSSFFTAKGKATVQTIEDLCGLTVAVEKGTVQQDEATEQAKKCPADKKLDLLVFPDQNAVNLSLTSGRAQVSIADSPVAAYIVKQSGGKLELSGDAYNSAPYGIAVAKGSDLAGKVQTALKELIADGTYKQILAKWGITQGAIADPKVNGAES